MAIILLLSAQVLHSQIITSQDEFVAIPSDTLTLWQLHLVTLICPGLDQATQKFYFDEFMKIADPTIRNMNISRYFE